MSRVRGDKIQEQGTARNVAENFLKKPEDTRGSGRRSGTFVKATVPDSKLQSRGDRPSIAVAFAREDVAATGNGRSVTSALGLGRIDLINELTDKLLERTFTPSDLQSPDLTRDERSLISLLIREPETDRYSIAHAHFDRFMEVTDSGADLSSQLSRMRLLSLVYGTLSYESRMGLNATLAPGLIKSGLLEDEFQKLFPINYSSSSGTRGEIPINVLPVAQVKQGDDAAPPWNDKIKAFLNRYISAHSMRNVNDAVSFASFFRHHITSKPSIKNDVVTGLVGAFGSNNPLKNDVEVVALWKRVYQIPPLPVVSVNRVYDLLKMVDIVTR